MQHSLPLTLDGSALGHYMAEQEQTIFDEAVSDLFGYHALQIGWQGYDLLAKSRIPNKHYLSPRLETRTSLLCDGEYLPFAEGSVDLVCLPHGIEQSVQPQQALREVYRVLVPDGVIILTGICPYSVLGIRSKVGWLRQAGQFKRLFTMRRMRDWLEVLGFEVIGVGRIMHALPVNDARWLARQDFLERWGQYSYGVTGGVYYMIAKKRVYNLRLLKPDWKKAQLSRALSAGKVHGRIQKQLKCRDDNTTNN